MKPRALAVAAVAIIGLAVVWLRSSGDAEGPASAPAEAPPDASAPALRAPARAPRVSSTPPRARARRRARVPPFFSPAAARARSAGIPPERTSEETLTTSELGERDPVALGMILDGLKGNRMAIRHCVFDLEDAVEEPAVLEWDMVLDISTDDDVVRVEGAEAEWPEVLSNELRECFATAFTGLEFDALGERFRYRFAYKMALSVAPAR